MFRNLLNKALGDLSFMTVRRTLAVMALIVGASFCFLGDKFHSQAPFFYLNQLPIPWYVYGVWFIVAAILMGVEKYRPAGYAIGSIIYLIFSIAAWLAVLGGLHVGLLFLSNFPKGTAVSFFGAANMTSVTVVYLVALKHSIYKQVDPEAFNDLF